MKNQIAVLSFFILSSWTAAAGPHGGIVGNGGNGVYCQKSSENDLHGYYSLDYILTLGTGTPAVPVGDWSESADRLEKLLKAKAPALGDSFAQFRRLLYNRAYTEKKVWEPAPFGLTQLDDQRITSQLPANCKKDGRVELVQAVIRQDESFSGTHLGKIIYKFDPDFLKTLEAQAPLQLSYLLVHEWLWDISTNVDRNRRINHFLHSSEFDSMSPEQVVATIKGMGLSVPNQMSDAFDDAQWKGYPLDPEPLLKIMGRDEKTWKVIGDVLVDRRQRDINCAEGTPACDPNWKRTSRPTPVFRDHRFHILLVSPEADRQYPIHILSPSLLTSQRQSVRPGSTQIRCRFIKHEKYNLECRFEDPLVVNALFGIFTSEVPYAEWPVAYAQINEDSFRMVISYGQDMEVFGRNRATIGVLYGNVMSSRFRLVLPTPMPESAPAPNCEAGLTKPTN